MLKRTREYISREMVKANPKNLYLYGDNSIRKGLKGQAEEMRGQFNTCGIITKLYPGSEEYCFLNDKYIIRNKAMIESDIARAFIRFVNEQYESIIVPPLGEGLAKLKEKAPLTWKFLQDQIDWLEQQVKNRT